MTLKYLKDNPHATQADIAARIGKSPATVKRLTMALQRKGLLTRRNGRRDGWWEVCTGL